jgi:hypothetical protein
MKSSIGKRSAIFGAIFLVSASFDCSYAQQASKDDLPSRFQHSLDLFNGGHCQEAWNELWKLAQNRDYYALYILAGSALGQSFRLSVASGTNIAEKIYLPMEIYATLTSETISLPFSIDMIRRLIPTTIAYSRDLDPLISKKVTDCFASKESPEVCARLAVESHLIPEYDAYIATVNQINQASLHVECAWGDRIPKSRDPQKNR